ncbi:TerC family protein [Marinimicrococcus flavescens]|uniref:TerC family protein n=1 Tax=Marinimicrococcus flavescens TaxID=3031815 RepID=A0AAP3UXC0_9PROT|nr:TerC family protein [Marinimicrococcus flavescens]
MDAFPVFLTEPWLGKPLWLWLLFLGVVLALLVLDLGLLNRKDKTIGVRRSLALSSGYVAVACLFGIWVWWWMGSAAALDWYTAYFVEKSLSLDNVFVISVIFTYLAVPRELQHRVLFWGILGVIVMRGLMIALGVALLDRFEWVLYLFAVFLLFSGVRMLTAGDSEPDIGKNPVLRFLRRHFRVTQSIEGPHFLVRQEDPKTGRDVWHATPLLIALVLVESADLVFAVDSIPAVFAITRDPYIVYTSNIFAVLGLRALYFALAAMVHRFHYLKYALGAVLLFIGGKIFYAELWAKPDPAVSLLVTAGLLGGGVLISLLRTRERPETERA